MTPAERLLLLALASKALIPHAEAELHRQADQRIREAMRAVEREAYGEQCADTDGLAAERDPMRAGGSVRL